MVGAPPERWLADEMLGRLARFLRMAGADTAYVRGVSDEVVRQRALSEGRTLLTRDRTLAARTPGSLRIDATALVDQLRVFHAANPEFALELRFDRCTLCNGRLTPVPADRGRVVFPDITVPDDGRAIYQCVTCGHPYWEGHHTAEVRRTFQAAHEERALA